MAEEPEHGVAVAGVMWFWVVSRVEYKYCLGEDSESEDELEEEETPVIFGEEEASPSSVAADVVVLNEQVVQSTPPRQRKRLATVSFSPADRAHFDSVAKFSRNLTIFANKPLKTPQSQLHDIAKSARRVPLEQCGSHMRVLAKRLRRLHDASMR
ncbi:MAG: hypothetical protein MHM6MM_001246 [Cercozoa sp. M6MM]